MFWCNCVNGYIYPSRKDVVRRLEKIWRMQHKPISTYSANAFNAKNADILSFIIRWIRNFILRLKATMSWTHLKVVYLFYCMELFSWFKRIKNHLKNIWQSTCCWWTVQQSYDSVLSITHWCHCMEHSPRHLSSWANECSNETNVHCVLPPSRHTKHQTNECMMDGFWCD